MVSAEWAQVITRWFELGFGLITQAAFYVLMWVAIQRVTEAMKKGGGPTLSGKVALLRLVCKHRVVARTRDRFGRHMTACARCGKDVNEGKSKWEHR